MKVGWGTVMLVGIAVVLLTVYLLVFKKDNQAYETLHRNEIAKYRYGVCINDVDVKVGKIQSNQVLSQVLSSLGATSQDIANISLLKKEEFDVRTFRAGNPYMAFYTKDSTCKLTHFIYEPTPFSYTIFHLHDTFAVTYGKKPTVLKPRFSEATITTSLWNATADNNINPALALELSDIYAWTIDFFGLQKGDSFSAIYDEIFVDGESMGISRIHAASFNHSSKTIHAFYYEQDSLGSYWDEKGQSLKKAFLKAPLQFSRISSHFSYARKHPILRTVRPHTGIDYAAPKGTPVMSIGDGTVIEKGYKGQGGNTVKIKHNSVYTTAYLHLSGYAKGLSVGSRVAQGQVIGYVGSTGLSSGPHLDFRVWKSGSPVNPLTVESPPVDPIKEQNRAPFDSTASYWLQRLHTKQ